MILETSDRYHLGKRSERRLVGVHGDLVAVVRLAIKLTMVDFGVYSGVRTLAEQQRLVDKGSSWTLDSRHLTGHAVDLVAWVDGKWSWDWGNIDEIARAMREAIEALGLQGRVEWGGDWKKRDGAHWELSRVRYPKKRT